MNFVPVMLNSFQHLTFTGALESKTLKQVQGDGVGEVK